MRAPEVRCGGQRESMETQEMAEGIHNEATHV